MLVCLYINSDELQTSAGTEAINDITGDPLSVIFPSFFFEPWENAITTT